MDITAKKAGSATWSSGAAHFPYGQDPIWFFGEVNTREPKGQVSDISQMTKIED